MTAPSAACGRARRVTRSSRSPHSGDVGTVHEAGGGVYVVALDDGTRVEASLRGRLKQEQRTGSKVVIGDRVAVGRSGDAWTIESVEPRASELVRRKGRRAPQVLVANLDRVFVIVALREPTATPHLIDRLLVLVESSGLHPTLVLNKVDLEGAREAAGALAGLYRAIGYDVLVTSAKSGEGVPQLAEALGSATSTFIGPSGAGKSSLLNAVDPELSLRTGALSRKTGTGRHTTVGSRLIDLEGGGLVADTPGFGDVGLWEVPPDRVAQGFPEIAALEDGCRFRRCAHMSEPDCAVREAVEVGQIVSSRYESYRTLRAEA